MWDISMIQSRLDNFHLVGCMQLDIASASGVSTFFSRKVNSIVNKRSL